jgi:hypothetical protein
MATLIKDRWAVWARDWGLSHGARGGLVRRTETVAGERHGLLFTACSGDDQYPGLSVTVRFPRTLDVQGLRARLADDASLDTLPGRTGARRATRVVTTVKPVVRWGKPPEYSLTESSFVWRRVFPWRTPKPAQVQAWVDTLVDAVSRSTPVFNGRCESCGTVEVPKHVLVDGVPMRLCAGCQQRTLAEGEMAERAYEMTEANHGVGAALAGFAAIVGAVAWAAVSALTQREFAAAAIGIGVLVAWAYRRGAGRVDVLGRVVGAAFTLASVTLGDILLFAWWVAKARPDVGYQFDAGLYVYGSAWHDRPADQVITLLFASIGAWVAFKALERPKLRHTIQQAGDAASATKRAA